MYSSEIRLIYSESTFKIHNFKEKDKSGEVLEKVVCELKGTQESVERDIEEENYKKCLQEAENRRAAIKLAKDKLALKSGPSLVLQAKTKKIHDVYSLSKDNKHKVFIE